MDIHTVKQTVKAMVRPTGIQTDLAISTLLLILIQNIYTLFYLPHLLLPVSHIFNSHKVLIPFLEG